jgi:hypothetical protein
MQLASNVTYDLTLDPIMNGICGERACVTSEKSSVVVLLSSILRSKSHMNQCKAYEIIG